MRAAISLGATLFHGMTNPTGQKGRTYPSRVWEHVGKRGLAKVFGRTPFVFQKIVNTAPMMAQPKVA